MVPTCQAKITTSMGKWVRRADPPTKLRKERQVRVRHEELGTKGIQVGIGDALDGGDVDGAVVHAEVIAVDQYGQGCDSAEPDTGDLASETTVAWRDVL